MKVFLKICKCSKIKSKNSNESCAESGESREIINNYEKMLIEAEKEYIKNENVYRLAMNKKNETIDMLNIVIE